MLDAVLSVAIAVAGVPPGGEALPVRVKDVCPNRIVGYSISDRMTAKVATTALRTR